MLHLYKHSSIEPLQIFIIVPDIESVDTNCPIQITLLYGTEKRHIYIISTTMLKT